MKTVGEVVRTLRERNQWNQQTLGDLCGCSLMTIHRIENNETRISPYMESKLNTIFNVNIYKYNEIIEKYNDFETYDKYCKFKNLILLYDFEGANKLYLEYKDLDSFQSGEPAILIKLAQILKEMKVEKSERKQNDHEIMEIAYEALGISSNEELQLMLNQGVHSVPIYVLINIISMLEYNLGNREEEIAIQRALYKHFNTFIFDNENYPSIYAQDYNLIRLYLAYTVNLGNNLYFRGEYLEASKLASVAIEKANSFETTHALISAYSLKFQSLYSLGEIEESRKCYNTFNDLCQSLNKDFLSESQREGIRTEFPLLFEEEK